MQYSSHTQPPSQRGNAMIYVLIALALFGALTVTLSSQNEQADGQEISDEQAELYAVELIEYAASAKNVIDQMIMTGTDIDELDLVKPTEGSFDTPPHIHKIFHPSGGGLNYQEKFNEEIGNFISAPNNPGWFIIKNSNTEWTPTPANDVILSALRIKKEVCAKINEKITGSKTIPQTQGGTLAFLTEIFEFGNTEFNSARCSECEGYPMMCVENPFAPNYGFYSIVAAR